AALSCAGDCASSRAPSACATCLRFISGMQKILHRLPRATSLTLPQAESKIFRAITASFFLFVWEASMKRSLLILCALITLMGVVAQAQAAPAAGARKKRVAVFDFDYATVRTNSAALFGSDVDVGKGMADLLVKYLVKDGTYSVIERKAMDKILAEQNFSNSDRANPTSAAKLGKLLCVDAIIVGSVTQFGNDTKNTNIGGGGGGWGGYGIGGFGHKKSKAIVAVDARIINIETAEIMAVAEGKGESSRESTSLLGGGSNWHGFGGGAVDFGSSDF